MIHCTLQYGDCFLVQIEASLFDSLSQPICGILSSVSISFKLIASAVQALLVLHEEELKALADSLDLGAHLLAHPDRAFHVLPLLVGAFGNALLEGGDSLEELLVLSLEHILLLLHLLDYLKAVVYQVDANGSFECLLLLGLVLAELLPGGGQLGLKSADLLSPVQFVERYA